MTARIAWPTVVARAEDLVRRETASLGVPPTLRRVHYLLVSDAIAADAGYINTQSSYKGLSDKLARARESGGFPALSDLTRRIQEPFVFGSEDEARRWLSRRFELDRRQLLGKYVVVAVEKDGLVPLIQSRFGWMDVTAVRGYTSYTHAQDLSLYDVIVYAGDYDPTGLDIDRDLSARTFADVRRVALTGDQVVEYDLTPMPVKATDSRLAAMYASQGEAMQVELDAMDPNVLLDLIAEGIEDATGIELAADGSPVAPDLDAEEAEIRERLRST